MPRDDSACLPVDLWGKSLTSVSHTLIKINIFYFPYTFIFSSHRKEINPWSYFRKLIQVVDSDRGILTYTSVFFHRMPSDFCFADAVSNLEKQL